ncbi:MAG: hypothetical protein KKE72_07160 [Gammaproteobacteria bacterium]|nr:hypothetical protein [Gammaproteobacteria bacterium]
MKLKNKLNRTQLSSITLCLGASLGMSVFVGNSSPFIGLMFGTVSVGVYLMIISGKWSAKNT